ncbi:large extracellular alpha-helical protein [Microbacterium sp. Root166]|uniref:DUF5719 family protein n=1 Tax=Microbacterium sp. Root166 TaxID=1736478 RepID=UPI0006F5006D|nr:DUF5719 family protein [Microbacterium sp. Root166]KQZ82089.1 large extracellular alpha-helical protein [Microbacterium sp. Root166]
MSDRPVFRWATNSARMLVGTVVSVVAVVAVVTAVSVPWPTVEKEPVSVSAVPAPAPSVIVCDGPLLSIGRDVTNVAALAVATPQRLIAGVSAGAQPPEESMLSVAELSSGEGPAVFTAQPENRARVDVAAAGAATVAADDLAGFAASACRPPLMESWLIGGSARTGAADLVLLSNPGVVPATVQLTVFGAEGASAPPGGTDVVIPAGSQRVLPLAGLVSGEESPVLRVSAVGSPIHASLQTSLTRTLTPGGVDQVGPVAEPLPAQTITGISVTRSPGAEGASDAATVLRLLAPSSETSALVTVTPVGRAEPALEPQTVPLVAGQPVEIELGGLAVGSYTVAVTAGEPILAAVWQTTGFEEGSDFAWYLPSPTVSVPSIFAAPSGPPPALTLVNPSSEPVDISVASEDGSYRLELSVPAQASMTARLSPRTVYVLDPGGNDILAGLSLTGDGALAGIPVWPADAAAPEITVYP